MSITLFILNVKSLILFLFKYQYKYWFPTIKIQTSHSISSAVQRSELTTGAMPTRGQNRRIEKQWKPFSSRVEENASQTMTCPQKRKQPENDSPALLIVQRIPI
jgi:hypothetical protein